MFGSAMIEVAIGLVFTYLLMSLICSAINEMIEAKLKNRATDLEKGIRELFMEPEVKGSGEEDEKGMVQKLYEHPLICGLFGGGFSGKLITKSSYWRSTNLPSYIPNRNFAVALIDIVMSPPGTTPSSSPVTIDSLRAAVGKIQNNDTVKRALSNFLATAGDDINRVRESIEAWFNSSMDRVTGWYKRRTQWILLVLGLVLSILLNVNTFTIAEKLWIDPSLRSLVVTQATDRHKARARTAVTVQDKRSKQTLRFSRKTRIAHRVAQWPCRHIRAGQEERTVEGGVRDSAGSLWVAIYGGGDFLRCSVLVRPSRQVSHRPLHNETPREGPGGDAARQSDTCTLAEREGDFHQFGLGCGRSREPSAVRVGQGRPTGGHNMSSGQNDNAVSVNRDLTLLAPKFREAVEAAINDCQGRGLDAYVYEAYRSQELQALYYARGRTVIPPVRTVTNAASNLYSWHGYRLAVDVISRSHAWSVPESWFSAVAESFSKFGCKWGGDWKQKDTPHFQWGKCKPSPSDAARQIMHAGGVEAVWRAVDAI